MQEPVKEKSIIETIASHQAEYDRLWRIIKTKMQEVKDKCYNREFVIYTGDGKGNLVPIEQTERFHQMMLEYVQKMYPDK